MDEMFDRDLLQLLVEAASAQTMSHREQVSRALTWARSYERLHAQSIAAHADNQIISDEEFAENTHDTLAHTLDGTTICLGCFFNHAAWITGQLYTTKDLPEELR